MVKERRIRFYLMDEHGEGKQLISDFIDNHPELGLEFEGVHNNLQMAIKAMYDHGIDVLLVYDVQCKSNLYENLMEFPEFIRKRVVIIGKDINSAVLAFRAAVFDILMYPLNVQDIKQFQRRFFIHKANTDKQQFENMSRQTLIINRHEKTIFVDVKEILRLEAKGSYTEIFLDNGSKISSSKSIMFYEGMLLKHNFYKVHRSHLICLDKIKELMKMDGDGVIVLQNGSKVNLSRTKKNEFLRKVLIEY